MATEFIGYSILVTLQSPPNAKLQGIVANVVGQQLFLRDVYLYWSGQHLSSYVLDSSRIADLEVAPAKRNENIAPVNANPQPTPYDPLSSSELSAGAQNVTRAPTKSTTPSFVDPAILSYAKPSKVDTRVVPTQIVNPPVASPVMIGDSVTADTPTTVVFHPPPPKGRTDSTATLTEPFNSQKVGAATMKVPAAGVDKSDGVGQPTLNDKAAGKKNRRGGKKGIQDGSTQTGPGIIAVKDLTESPMEEKKPGRGKGWRQTPLIEEATPRKSRHNRNKKSLAEDMNGWATEDATDIQDMGEFDFISNHLKFDKRQVFDDIRSKDKTAEEDRLVSHNRLARPGTNGGRNLHYTENVLDTPPVANQWKSEADETEEEVRDERYSSSRASRTEQSKTRKGPVSRKGSGQVPNQPLHASLLKRTGSSRTESPRPSVSRLGLNASPMNGSIARGTFRMKQSNKPCPTVSPLQMLEIEQVCTADLGLTEDMLTENAARGIAEAVLKHSSISTPSGNVLILAGNHKSGSRAIATARHLRNRNMRVSVCILGGDREDLLLESLRRQMDIYKKGGGRIVKWDEFQSRLTEWSPHLIIDALLGMHVAFEDLRLDQQGPTFEMIRWMNRSDFPIFSIDVPSGLVASTGEITETDSGPLIVQSTNIVSLGAPKNCLLEAMAREEEGLNTSWSVCVADIGISAAAWKKFGTRRRQGVEFGKDWVIDLSYQA